MIRSRVTSRMAAATTDETWNPVIVKPAPWRRRGRIGIGFDLPRRQHQELMERMTAHRRIQGPVLIEQ